jgi:hypothetical protein
LREVYVDEGCFDSMKEDSEKCFEQTSIRLDLLVPKYLMFCTKHGLAPLSIKEEEKILKRYQLKLKYKERNNAFSYTNLRWRTDLEKVNDTGDDKKVTNHIKKFIKINLYKCTYETDYILVTELQERYDQYCINHNVDPLTKGNISRSPEIEKYGGVLKQDLVIPFILGITKKIVSASSRNRCISGIVMKPTSITEEISSPWNFIGNKFLRIRLYLFGNKGFLGNLLFILVYLILIIAIPLLYTFATIWSLQQINIMNSDIYAPVYTLDNVFLSSSDEFWLTHLDFNEFLYALFGMNVIFVITGILEFV